MSKKETHRTVIVTRPPVEGSRHSRARALCSCGWQGHTYDAYADATLEAQEHKTQFLILSVLGEA